MADSGSERASKTSNPASDAEGGEKPVREQLKKTSIDASVAAARAKVNNDTSEAIAEKHNVLRRKRSRDDDDGVEDPQEGTGRHVRKRSRDNESESPVLEASGPDTTTATESKINGTSQNGSTPPPTAVEDSGTLPDAIVSPKGKRTRAQFQKDDQKEATSAITTQKDEEIIKTSALDTAAAETETDERGAKRPRELDEVSQPSSSAESKSADAKVAPTSGFGNVSSVSPFASLSSKPVLSSASAPSEQAATQPPAMTASPFGSLGQTTGANSPFASLSGKTSSFAPIEKKSESAFGGSTTQSGFGSISKSGSSGFGGLTAGSSSSPFASALSGRSAFGGFGTTAGSGTKPPILGLSAKPARPFGAPQSDEDDEGSEDDADATDVSKDIEQGISSPSNEPKRDKRFVEQEVETGEENERTLFSSRAKLYYFDTSDKSWKERGVGGFKVNITRSSVAAEAEENSSPDSAASRKARFIMRAEGSHRLILNSPLTKQTKFGDANGACPKATTALWHGVLDGHDKPVGLQLKMKADLITSLWEVVNDAKAELS